MFDWAGEQFALYCGHSVGDLVIITMENAVEATLAIILLLKCRLRLLQATIVGVVLLHLLLIPGTSFLVGGARLLEQHLNAHVSQLNHSLLSVGVMTLLLPAAFFAASIVDTSAALPEEATKEVTHKFLSFSRGLAIILLLIYVGSRIFLHNPPGDDNALQLPANAPEALRQRERELEEKTPKLSPWVCLVIIPITIALMAITAEFLVESIERFIEESHMTEEFVGLILLPIVSFSADALIATIYFIRRSLFLAPRPPDELAKSRAIDLSIQFVLFWMPFFVLLAWWTHRPLSLLFDLFEVALVIGACLLVNYITADSKTNWAEGMMMICFYVSIALVAWYYDGQPLVAELLNQGRCFGLAVPAHEGGGGGAEGSTGGSGTGVAEGAGGGAHGE
jgi:Ca2+:H+ antiporter